MTCCELPHTKCRATRREEGSTTSCNICKRPCLVMKEERERKREMEENKLREPETGHDSTSRSNSKLNIQMKQEPSPSLSTPLLTHVIFHPQSSSRASTPSLIICSRPLAAPLIPAEHLLHMIGGSSVCGDATRTQNANAMQREDKSRSQSNGVVRWRHEAEYEVIDDDYVGERVG